MTLAYLALGSNLGDRQANLDRALTLLEDHPAVLPVATSSYYETEPVLLPSRDPQAPKQEWYLNAVTVIKTELSPTELLDVCLDIERELGRERTPGTRWESRLIDLDILFYGDEILCMEDPPLTIPHPHLHERAFVLVPLLELQPDFRHPVLEQTISQLHLALENPCTVQLYGQRTD